MEKKLSHFHRGVYNNFYDTWVFEINDIFILTSIEKKFDIKQALKIVSIWQKILYRNLKIKHFIVAIKLTIMYKEETCLYKLCLM